MIYKNATNDDAQVLKVHFAPTGEAWVGPGDRKAEVCKDVSKLVDQYKTVRVAGTPSNWSWIGGQTDLVCQKKLEVVGSAVTKDVQDQPQVCISLLRCVNLSGSKGGVFHPKAADLDLFMAAGAPDSELKSQVLGAWYSHFPVAKVLEWIPLDKGALVKVLAAIVDPRLWIGNKEGHEHSTSKLEQWFGLTPMGFAETSSGKPSARQLRARLVSCCWASKVSELSLEDPANFLCRILVGHEGSNKGLIRGSQVLMRIIRHVWMSYLYPAADLGMLLDPIWKSDGERQGFQRAYRSLQVGLL